MCDSGCVTVTTDRLLQRDLDDVANDPARMARNRESHAEGLRKLATAVRIAVGTGATREEIEAVLRACTQPAEVDARRAIAARARTHDGDPTF